VRALIVHCHPEPTSFNSTLTERAVQSLSSNDWVVEVSDLYQEGFDPVEKPDHYASRKDPEIFSPLAEQRHAFQTDSLPGEVEREIARLEAADLIILQFPLWWHSQPAMLKGWFDRVFINGGLYSSRRRYDAGHFKGKLAVCSVTTGAPKPAFGPGSRGGNLDVMLWPIEYSLYYAGFSVLPRFVSFGVQGNGYAYQSADELKQHLSDRLDAWGNRVLSLSSETPLSFPGWDNWNEHGRPLHPPVWR